MPQSSDASLPPRNESNRVFSPPSGQSSVTLDDRSRASNPGSLQVNYFHWFRSYPTWALIWLLPTVLFLYLAIISHWSFWILFVLFAIMNYLYWMRVKEHFLHGCVVPGVVVALDPMVLAFATDMSTGQGEFPAIKIVRKELKQIHGETPQVGMRLAGVALYGTSDNSLPHWEDFDPRPVQCAVPNIEVQRQRLATLDDEDFQKLLAWLQAVPREPGLYFIQPDGTAKKYTFVRDEDE